MNRKLSSPMPDPTPRSNGGEVPVWYALISLAFCATVASISSTLLYIAGRTFVAVAGAAPIASWGRPGYGLLIVMGFLALASWYFKASVKAAQKVLPARFFI
ncbi:TPA: hypothetical protein ACG5JQ_000052 [Stenotrophomonas maltophilia]|uniref:Transmembrane protein n=1 Tax=Stenotrophomonas maltophilia TaxID=40324 RepID=A0AAI9CFY3_STEMA|nr:MULTISPECIES: hypothetical protein [Stenotrophomonas]MPS45509.1 hypothetical protein [Stenotrophomonas sp.]EKT4440518.1 hypothetical protein [Stenotrophomonas maltophilia]EKT4444043.1 hypothetical protein [Stenotrophomonas maltophilia]EKT4444127.1 hypothetical protein [Stenotrophomonas maltophilia]ELC7363274.1 hypothetical protein [Stenotrophomonas maltophilia]